MERTTSPEPTRVFVSLGSNIRPWSNLPRAVELLGRRLEIEAVSSLYASEAEGSPDSPPFLNAAISLLTDLPPLRLKFDVLRPLEREMGRVRGDDRNAPREIDLDLALYGGQVLRQATDGVEVPDPDVERAAHVILPLAEIAPEMPHPVSGIPLGELAAPFRRSPDIVVAGTIPLPGREAP